MRRSPFPLGGAAAALVASLVALAACGSSEAKSQAPPPSVPSAGISAGSSASPASTPSVAAAPAVATEASERADVVVAWADYWHMYDTLLSQPESRWPTMVGKVAVDPIYSQLLMASRALAAAGLGAYGRVVIHPYWTQPINGKTTAVMRDCQDDSQSGSLVVKTRVKKTVGKAHNSIQATLVKGSDAWRVRQIIYLLNEKCGG